MMQDDENYMLGEIKKALILKYYLLEKYVSVRAGNLSENLLVLSRTSRFLRKKNSRPRGHIFQIIIFSCHKFEHSVMNI